MTEHTQFLGKPTAEGQRLSASANRQENWKRWGPYLSERQWGTVREDYSADGTCWDYFPHDHARSRAYRWGEDGLLGFSDRECRLCFALALWNGQDSILKERLFGLAGPEGNHGEDVKEEYFYLDSTPTHSYAKALYRYPQSAFPYEQLITRNRDAGRDAREFELRDTGVFDEGRYFDVTAEFAKRSPDDIWIRVTVANRGPEAATLHVLPTVWFRNTWSWGCTHEGCTVKPRIAQTSPQRLDLTHPTLGNWHFEFAPLPGLSAPEVLFTENETNTALHWNDPSPAPYTKDAFHRFVIDEESSAVNPKQVGTKAAPHYVLTLAPGESQVIHLRLASESDPKTAATAKLRDETFTVRIREADEFHESICPPCLSAEERNVVRQGYAGLLWSKQFYHYIVEDWLDGDSGSPTPPTDRKQGRNADWRHLYSRDVISMPDKWEYPWFAAWDLAFHMIPFARLDAEFAKRQLTLFLREWYMHPNGQIPAYEFALGDVNPPVHAWAVWRVYKITGQRGQRDRDFLESAFQKLLLNFTWWVNRKDAEGKNLFSGGFLGLDNIGVFDRSKPLPTGGSLQQADGTAWMAFYCATMLGMAIELAHDGERLRTAYEDMASKFLEHFVQIIDSINRLGGCGLWNDADGFYYDQIAFDHSVVPLKTRSMVGLLPLIAVELLDDATLNRLPGFKKRFEWFLQHKSELARHISERCSEQGVRMIAIQSETQLRRVLQYMLNESEFLSPHGIRSLSKFHETQPYLFEMDGQRHEVRYVPGESNTGLFGGNSNWRGPVWFPVNYLIVEALERYHRYYGDEFTIECPTGSGNHLTLQQVAHEIERRLAGLFMADSNGRRPCHGADERWANDPNWKDLVLFHEYFHGETGEGLGASHQTGWTALAIRCIKSAARQRAAAGKK